MQGVKEKALELLASGKAQRVLGWKTGEFFYDLTPGVFESAEEVEREFEYGVFAGANLSKYCIAESKKDGVTAVFLKPCDTYSFVQLLKEYKIKREKVYIVGVQCDGMCDMEKIRAAGISGATAVSVGTANFYHPHATEENVDGIRAYMERYQVEDIRELIGAVHDR